jgi:hypothetical protein
MMPDNTDEDVRLVDEPLADSTDDTTPVDITDIEEPAVDELVDEEEIDDETLNNSQYFDDISDDSVR